MPGQLISTSSSSTLASQFTRAVVGRGRQKGERKITCMSVCIREREREREREGEKEREREREKRKGESERGGKRERMNTVEL